MAPINVGVVGYGNSARVFHLPYILNVPDLKLYAFMQRTPAPQAGSKPDKPHCTIDYPDAKHYTDVESFLADEQIELVVILTRPDSHADIAEKALRAGKNVVVEKPITEDLASAERLVQVKDETGNLLVPFQNRRYDSDFQTVQELIRKEALGELLEFETHYDLDLPGWVTGIGAAQYKQGDGLMYGIGVHKFDHILSLFGRPATVTAWLRSVRPGGEGSDVEDSYTVILTYDASGPYKNLLVTVKTMAASVMRAPLAYLIRGREGSFVKFGDDPQEVQIPAGMKVTDSKFGVEAEDIWGELTTTKQFCDSQQKVKDRWVGKYESKKGSYSQYYADVAKAVRGGEQVVKIETSRDGIRLCEVARESAKAGKTMPFI